MVVDSSIIDSPLNEAIQIDLVHYSHSADFQGSEKFEFCSVISERTSSSMIRWTRHPLQQIESQVIRYKDIFAYEPFLLTILDNDVFIDLVLASNDETDFPHLGDYMQKLFYNKNPDINYAGSNISTIATLIDLDKSALKAQRVVREIHLTHKLICCEFTYISTALCLHYDSIS